MNQARKQMISSIIAAIFIFLFAYTAISKFTEFSKFMVVIRKSPLIGEMPRLVAWLVPIAELFTVALLFFNATRSLGFLYAFCLMLTFTVYIGYMLAFAPHLPCSCGGVLRKLSWSDHLFLNIALTMLAGWAYLLNRKSKPQFLNKEIVQTHLLQ